MTPIDDRVEKILSSIKISDIFPELNSKSSICPSCGKRGKFYQINSNQLAKCYSASCIFNRPKNVINSYRWKVGLEHKSGFYEAIQKLESEFGLTNVNLVPKRSKVLEECLDIYQYYLWSPIGKEALNYLKSRGFIDEIIKQQKIGYAPHISCLREFDISIDNLKQEGLLFEGKEHFSNRIILPIRDIKSNLIHFTGRYVGEVPKSPSGEDMLGRYKESKSLPNIPSSKSFLAFENNIEGYIKQTDTLIVAEGYLDALTLIQLGIPSVATFGLEKISSHYNKFSKFKKLVFMFDNDTFDINHPTHPLEYKSWIRVLPQLIELQVALPKVKIYTCLVPNNTKTSTGGIKSTKDINDWISTGNIKSVEVSTYIEKNKQELVESLISKWGCNIEHHLTLLRLIKVVNREELKKELSKYIQPNLDILDYALNLVSA